ncbi:MAG: cytochrome c oxidase subunit 3 [Lewinellaceae bacterium]|nr:cytochrome c oxidase subunit 3 [Lewinellaceae bacterium]
MQTLSHQESYTQSKIHPHKLALWISLASILMMFGAFTSAYMVRKGAGNWLDYEVPGIFYVSTVVMLLSSVTIQYAYLSYKSGKELLYKGALVLTFLLGIGFLILQYKGWMDLYGIGIEINGNPSGSFFYAISGVHAAHVLGGLAIMVVAMVQAFSLPFTFLKNRLTRLELTTTYWHFVDLLWVYLLFFLLIQ